MVKQTQLALSDAAEWLGDWHPLAEQLGSTDGLVTLGSVSASLRLAPVHNLPSLRHFLRELPVPNPPARSNCRPSSAPTATRRATKCANWSRSTSSLAGEPILSDFAAASRRVGQSQLRKLRPLRDQRVVQRYLHAVESGQAHGWHTLVYGLTLAVYSLPLRQGLLGYAHQTTRGFIYSAARMLRLSEHQCRALFELFAPTCPKRSKPCWRNPQRRFSPPDGACSGRASVRASRDFLRLHKQFGLAGTFAFPLNEGL